MSSLSSAHPSSSSGSTLLFKHCIIFTRGILRFCTRSIIFQPNQPTESLIRIPHTGSTTLFLNKSSLSSALGSENVTLDPTMAKSTQVMAPKLSSPKSRQKEPNYFSMKNIQKDLSRWTSIPVFKKPVSNRKACRKIPVCKGKSTNIFRVNLTSRDYFSKSI